mgnify:FL=1|tara:strand:- start:433 stop:702 length:270 start_codon:yes stop_codon:yes gene_type:complete
MGKYRSKKVKEYMRSVAELGCICCGRTPELHHPRFNVGLSQRGDDMDVIPLCPEHHRYGKISIHLGKKEFVKRFGTEKELVEKVKRMLE